MDDTVERAQGRPLVMHHPNLSVDVAQSILAHVGASERWQPFTHSSRAGVFVTLDLPNDFRTVGRVMGSMGEGWLVVADPRCPAAG